MHVFQSLYLNNYWLVCALCYSRSIVETEVLSVGVIQGIDT